MRDIMDTVNQWLDQEQAIALATVVATWGSAPRGVGAKMAVTADMAMVGSVSGGCVETAVVEEALEALANNQPKLLHFGVSDDMAWDVGLTCGGRISVFVEPLDRRWWEIVTGKLTQNETATTVTVLEGDQAGQKVLLGPDSAALLSTADNPERLASLSTQRSGQSTLDDRAVMVDHHQVRPHLIIIGGVHVAMPLKNYAHELGYRVSLIDPRQVFATPERFPDVEAIHHSYPDKALADIGLDRESYVAVLTHDPKIDDKALIAALPSDAPYVGVLSSSRTHEKRLQRLREAGLSETELARIRTPIGIDIAAQTPEEIALCIMAEIVAVRNGAIT
jgi:xanthine dehydrogenase accessory factor